MQVTSLLYTNMNILYRTEHPNQYKKKKITLVVSLYWLIISFSPTFVTRGCFFSGSFVIFHFGFSVHVTIKSAVHSFHDLYRVRKMSGKEWSCGKQKTQNKSVVVHQKNGRINLKIQHPGGHLSSITVARPSLYKSPAGCPIV